MALYVSLLRPINSSLCHNHYIVQVTKTEGANFRLFSLKNVHFKSSTFRKHSGWQLKNSKSIHQNEGENHPFIANPTPFSFQLLVKPFLFTVAFSSASIAASAIWQYENVRKRAMSLMKKSWLTDKLHFYGKKKYTWRTEINKFWNQLTEGQKLFVPICFINILIFLAWRVPKFQPVMIKYFCSTPFSSKYYFKSRDAVCWPMILCTFSHYNVFHLATNMYVLHSFSSGGVEVLGKEQFLGLYLAGGVISSFFSCFYKTIISNQSLSMGASGAVMAILAYSCSKYPDSKLTLVFLPYFIFSAGAGIKCLMGLDLLGVILRWRFFDHAAHLGGALTGLAWCYWGNSYIWQKREPLLHWWHEIRTASK